jgi:rSAM/selenodomain-associated transferase 2
LDPEVSVVDGGSTDATPDIARAHSARVIASAPGRGRQMAAGATAATGEWLLFLHADTRLQPGWNAAVAAHMTDPALHGTAAVFRLAFDDDSPPARRTAALANWRARRLGLPYGDQGLLISRTLYDQVGGFADIPLMEDVVMARRLGRRRIRMLDAKAVTSAEKYRRDGWWRRSATNLTLLSLYFLGVPPDRLARLYR